MAIPYVADKNLEIAVNVPVSTRSFSHHVRVSFGLSQKIRLMKGRNRFRGVTADARGGVTLLSFVR